MSLPVMDTYPAKRKRSWKGNDSSSSGEHDCYSDVEWGATTHRDSRPDKRTHVGQDSATTRFTDSTPSLLPVFEKGHEYASASEALDGHQGTQMQCLGSWSAADSYDSRSSGTYDTSVDEASDQHEFHDIRPETLTVWQHDADRAKKNNDGSTFRISFSLTY